MIPGGRVVVTTVKQSAKESLLHVNWYTNTMENELIYNEEIMKGNGKKREREECSGYTHVASLITHIKIMQRRQILRDCANRDSS